MKPSAVQPAAKRPRVRRSTFAAWPLWLLCAAWFCANSPQSACFEVIAWANGARSFSHQARLTLSVAHLLGDRGAMTPVVKTVAATTREAPAIPAEATIKKIELAAPRAALRVVGSVTFRRAWPVDATLPADVVGETPHGPPRERV